MKRLILLLTAAFLAGQSSAQLMRARIHEDFSITVEEVQGPVPAEFRGGNNFEQLPGFPKGYPASPNLKNFRNVALANLDDDAGDEILWPAGNRLFAYRHDGLLWEKVLSSEAIYPPAVADIDNDGALEIVQAAFGLQGAPLLYALEADGSDVPGWPASLDGNRIFYSPALSDLDGNGTLEIVVCARSGSIGRVYVLNADGSAFSEHWPVELDSGPATTPSVGDIDLNGVKDIVVHSGLARYAFSLDGELLPGFPVGTGPETVHTYQSPVLIDLENDGPLEIVGAAHGDAPEFFVTDNHGDYRSGWPKPAEVWTYTTPTVVELDGEPTIFMCRRIGDTPADMLYAWDAEGNLREGFPINKSGGNEGIISIADVDGDETFEVVFGSDLFTADGPGFLHAYELDGSGEVEGFPLRPRGINAMNGAALSDINNDGMMDLIAVSYTLTFGMGIDSVYLHAYNLNVPYSPERVLWSTYKGSNTRDGLLTPQSVSGTAAQNSPLIEIRASPNPAHSETLLSFSLEQPTEASIHLSDVLGREQQQLLARYWAAGPQQARIPLNNLPAGLYWISVRNGDKLLGRTPVLIR
ncbi:MAG: T9SS type A sorting domain-containing protein [Lewinellaceae bacterium]|nr:T9SS type A sorting domain-containing protein [Lewinellaceae bacterium]